MNNFHKRRKIKNKIFGFFCFFSLFLCCILVVLLIANIALDAYFVFTKPFLLIDNNYIGDNKIDESLLKNFIKDQNHDWSENEVRKIYNKLFLIKANEGKIYEKSDKKFTEIPLSFLAKEILQNKRNEDQLSINFLTICQNKNLIKNKFNYAFFINHDSVNPEQAGIITSLVGTLLVITVYLFFSVIVGVSSAIYIAYFLRSRRIRHFLLFNTYNLASLPPVVYGLISLFIFYHLFSVPRSSALIGGLTISLISMPNIIIIAKQAIKTVPIEIQEAALALGASRTRTFFDHVLPMAAPQIISGIMLGIVRVISETAPLLMVGMVIFSTNTPQNFTEPTNTITTQIYLWSKMKNEYFLNLSSAAILVLICILILIKLFAMWLIKKFGNFHFDDH